MAIRAQVFFSGREEEEEVVIEILWGRRRRRRKPARESAGGRRVQLHVNWVLKEGRKEDRDTKVSRLFCRMEKERKIFFLKILSKRKEVGAS